MCRVWNEHFAIACLGFLAAREDDLDVGCGLELQRDARAQESDNEALRWLQMSSCQGMLTQMRKGSSAANLPAERKHVETKRNEKSRLCHLATAGRDQLQRHVLRRRAEALRALDQAEKEHRRALHLWVSAVAWERMPHLVMVPENEIGKVPGRVRRRGFDSRLGASRQWIRISGTTRRS